MICANCRMSGEFNHEANRVGSEMLQAVLQDEARDAHRGCLDIVCTCQHFVGKVINEREPAE